MNKLQGYQKLLKLKRTLKKETQLHIVFKPNFPLIQSQTVRIEGTPIEIQIGTENRFQGNMFQEVNPVEFSRIILNMFHEAEHIKQYQAFKHKYVPPNLKYMAINDLACENNEAYYKSVSNYNFNPNEIQAEKHGLERTYQYFCTEFPEMTPQDHEELLLALTKDQFKNNQQYFIPNKDYKNLNEVFKAFDDAFEASKQHERGYFIGGWKNFKDPVMKHFQQNPEYFREKFTDLPTGMLRDKMIAKFTVQLKPEELQKYPCIRLSNLEYEPSKTRLKDLDSKFGQFLSHEYKDKNDMNFGQ